MQIELGLRGDYGIRAVLDVARHHRRGRRKTREIAQAMDIPPKYLSHILAALVHAGVLFATAGPAGGYQLVQPPGKTRLLDVINAVDDSSEIHRCVLKGIPCSSGDSCAIHHHWFAAQNAMRSELRRTTFAHLLRSESAPVR